MAQPKNATYCALALASLGLAWIATDSATIPPLFRTVAFASVTTLISLPMGLGLALVLFRSNARYRQIMRSILALLIFMPAYLQISGWDAAFGLQGWMALWQAPGPQGLLSGWTGALAVQSVVNLPWAVVLLSAGLAALPPEFEELASLESSPRAVLWRVTLPQLWPTIQATGLFLWIATSCEITVTDVYQIRTFAEEVYTGFALGETIAEVLLRTFPGWLIHLALALVMWPPQQSRPSDFPSIRTSVWRAELGRWRSWISALSLALLVFLILIPVASLLYQAGLQVTMESNQLVRSWSPLKAARFVATSPWHYREEYAWSFLLGQMATISAISAATMIAWQAQKRTGWRWIGWSVSLLAISIPGPVVALVLSELVNQPHSDSLFYLYDRTLLVAWISLTIRLFPFAYLIVDVRLRRWDRSLFDLAGLYGSRFWTRWWHGLLMPLREFWLWLWLVIFALAVGDLSATILATPPGVTTVAIRIFNLVHYGVADQLAGLCLGTMLLFGILAMLASGSISGATRGVTEETI